MLKDSALGPASDPLPAESLSSGTSENTSLSSVMTKTSFFKELVTSSSLLSSGFTFWLLTLGSGDTLEEGFSLLIAGKETFVELRLQK